MKKLEKLTGLKFLNLKSKEFTAATSFQKFSQWNTNFFVAWFHHTSYENLNTYLFIKGLLKMFDSKMITDNQFIPIKRFGKLS